MTTISKPMKNLLVAFALLLCANVNAQDVKSKVLKELASLTVRYQQAESLSFDVVYKYSSENAPQDIIETLRGNCKIKGRKSFYSIDQTQSVFDGAVAAIIYREDSLIYLSRPSSSLHAFTPVQVMDSMLSKQNVTYNLEEQKRTKRITLGFNGDDKFKEVIYEIDKSSGYLSKITQVVNHRLMYESENTAPVGSTNEYSIVETVFENYSTKNIGDEVFAIANYVRKENKDYVAVSPYNHYRVFLATPNL